MGDGGRIYSWVGGQKNVGLPGTAQTTTNIVGNTAFSTTTYQDGGELKLGCAVQIVADKGGVITTIKPTADSIGMWQLSRCAEIFGT